MPDSGHGLEGPTTPTVEPDDIKTLYNLLLRREPEGPHVGAAWCGGPLADYFYAILECEEFHTTILPAVVGRARWPRYRGRMSFDRLRAWMRSRPCLPPDVTQRLIASVSWREFYRVLLSETSILEQAPKLKAFGTDKMIAGLAATPRHDDAEIEGDCDYANIWEIKGWCVDLLDADHKPTVEILVGERVVGAVACREFRRDVQARMGGDGACGFTFAIPPDVREALREEQWLTIRERSTGAPLGQPTNVRNHGPTRVDQLDALRDELARTRRSLERLEVDMARTSASLGVHIAAYGDFARSQPEIDSSAAAKRLSEGLGSKTAPLVSVVLVGGDESALAVTLESLSAQLYPNWELVLAGKPTPGLADNLAASGEARREIRVHAGDPIGDAQALTEACLDTARGELVMILSPGDRLARDALTELAIAAERGGAAIVYADEDRWDVSAAGEVTFAEPRFKPSFDLDYLLSANFVGRAVMLRTAAVRELGGFRRQLAAEGLLDLVLRAEERFGDERIVHCARVLFHAPANEPPGDADAARQVIAQHLDRVTPGALATPHSDPESGSRPGARRIIWPVPSAPPPVSIIIPTRDHPELLGPCLASIHAHLGDYAGEVEIFVVDNGTSEPIASALLSSLAEAGAIRLARYPGPFNWSALNNRAVSEARGEVLVFLNNDIVMLRSGWLSELVGQALRPEIGVVGARLLYSDRSIQHAGAVLGVAGVSCHESIGEAVDDGGYLGRTQLQHRVSAVTGACLATRREVFERLGGFDEAAFKVAFNDTDYCMKAGAAGLAVIYTPFATMLHFESVSRGWNVPPPEAGEVGDEMTLFRERWRDALRHDPFYNPHFDRMMRPFTYLAPPRRSA